MTSNKIAHKGFNHSAFALRNEGRLQNSPYFAKHIPRGELIELLTKSLLYIEVESHWRGDELATNCKTGFSLLEPHTCSLEEPQTKSMKSVAVMDVSNTNVIPNSVSEPTPSTQPTTSQQAKNGVDRRISIRNGPAAPSDLPVREQVLQRQKQSLAPSAAENTVYNTKRKTSPVPTDDGHVEKRQRRASTDMEVDTTAPGKVYLYLIPGNALPKMKQTPKVCRCLRTTLRMIISRDRSMLQRFSFVLKVLATRQTRAWL